MQMQSLIRYITKKGIGYFISNPSTEDVEALKGVLFDEDGNLNINKLYILAGIPI